MNVREAKGYKFQPEEEWHRASDTVSYCRDELHALQAEREAMLNKLGEREEQLKAIIEAGSSVMKRLDAWGPQDVSTPMPDYSSVDGVTNR